MGDTSGITKEICRRITQGGICAGNGRVLRGMSGNNDNMQRQQEISHSKRKERMVRYLHFLVLSMVMPHKNMHDRLERQGNGQQGYTGRVITQASKIAKIIRLT